MVQFDRTRSAAMDESAAERKLQTADPAFLRSASRLVGRKAEERNRSLSYWN